MGIMTTEQRHWQSLHQMLQGYRTAQVLIAAVELKVFQALADGEKSVAELVN